MRLPQAEGEPADFGFLQLRPLVLSREGEDIRLDEVDPQKLICQSSVVLGHGRVQDLRDVIVVDSHRFERPRSREVAQAVAHLNAKLSADNRPYLLIGVGRWGSTDPWLGIPVAWDQISGARVIVESGFRDFRVAPSQGSHFFQNLTAFQIGYFTVNPDAGEGFIDWQWLADQAAVEELDCVRHLRFESPLVVMMNGKAQPRHDLQARELIVIREPTIVALCDAKNPSRADGLMPTTKYRTLVEALYAAPADRPFVTAWIDEDEQETITFGEFRRRARLQAALLRQNGVGLGDRVVLIMPQGTALMAAFAGAMLLGAVPAILAYPNFKVEPGKYRFGLAGVTANLQARAIVIDNEFPEDLLEHVSLTDDSRLLRAATSEGDLEVELPEPSFAPEALAFVQHSAGTTGLQKGVALTHAAVLRHLGHLFAALNIDRDRDSVYSWLPLYHDMGLIACFMLPMVCHLPVVMQSPLDWVMHPDTMLQIFTDHKCTLAWLPNFAFQFVPRRTPRERWTRYDMSSARLLINCSEPVRASSMNEFYDAFSPIGLKRSALQSSYAMAENVFAVTQSGIDGTGAPAVIRADGQRFRSEHFIAPVEEDAPGSIWFTSSGRLLPGNEARIVSEAGELLAEGFVGEITIRSDSSVPGLLQPRRSHRQSYP